MSSIFASPMPTTWKTIGKLCPSELEKEKVHEGKEEIEEREGKTWKRRREAGT